MLERQATIIAIAQKHQAQVNEKHIATKNFQYKHIDVTVFPVNSFVMVAYPNTKITASGAPHKLLTNWQGPYRQSHELYWQSIHCATPSIYERRNSACQTP